MKRRKIDDELNQCISVTQVAGDIYLGGNLDDNLDKIQQLGGSYLKYEIINKKSRDGKDKRVLFARRCSMRHQCFGLDQDFVIRNQLQECQNQSMDMSLEYRPSAVENLFAPADTQTKKI